MNLLLKSSLYYLALLIPALAISGLVFYQTINADINDNADESLMAQKKTIAGRLIKNDSIDFNSYKDVDDDVLIEILKGRPAYENRFTDISNYDSSRAEFIHYRKLESYFKKGERFIGISIIRSKLRSEELGESISRSMILLFGLLLVGFVTINRFVLRNLWRPFYESLAMLNSISFLVPDQPRFSPSSIKEFNEMNSSLNKMMAKMFADYRNQKQFTENASHELQTPLAIIKLKTDLLIQSKSITEDDMLLIAEIEKSVSKLSYLNRSLLLLSKIENHQFGETSPINISRLIEKVMMDFEDRITIRHITIQKQFDEDVILNLNPLITEILFSNLIQNAVRYNLDRGGVIQLNLTTSSFIIRNSGNALKGDPEKIFGRFVKFNSLPESMGLGLSIVKQVCEYYNFSILYSFQSNLHCFTINFSPDNLIST